MIDIFAVSNQVQLSWTALAAEFKLQSNTNLLATNGWVSAAAPPIHTNRLLTVSLPATNAAQSFRLSNRLKTTPVNERFHPRGCLLTFLAR